MIATFRIFHPDGAVTRWAESARTESGWVPLDDVWSADAGDSIDSETLEDIGPFLLSLYNWCPPGECDLCKEGYGELYLERLRGDHGKPETLTELFVCTECSKAILGVVDCCRVAHGVAHEDVTPVATGLDRVMISHACMVDTGQAAWEICNRCGDSLLEGFGVVSHVPPKTEMH